ncbi:MAG: acetoacetate decarboxylase family protein [Aquabacterium sp.]|jgi:hypothetical protein|uniref:acetoacetate decarboxylase family protein n=1 Tax=Aquabacterium sp. TaxID=1872578 RepID=UPI003BB190D6
MRHSLSFAPQGDDPFFDVPATTVQTSTGPVQLPILYRRTRNLNAFFMVPTERVNRVLVQKGAGALSPGCQIGGRALVALACYDYQDTSIGPYREIGLAVPVLPPGVRPTLRHWLQTLTDVDSPSRQLGFHVLHLPVDTEAACAAGREIWGLPKFVTPIAYEDTPGQARIVLHDPRHPYRADLAILRLEGRLGAGLPGPSVSPLLYSHHEGQWLRTPVRVRGGGQAHVRPALRLRTGGSAHPMAQVIRELGLDGARPWLAMATERFQSRLPAGQPMG